QGWDPKLHSFRNRILRNAYPGLLVFLRSATSRPQPERVECTAHARFQRLSFREQFHFLALRNCPNETAPWVHAWLARAHDLARRYLSGWPGNGVLEAVSNWSRSQHQSFFDHLLHSYWLSRVTRALGSDRAADFSLAGVGG